ncbi:MAG: ATP-binding protein [Bacteroidota bacterium]
MILKSEIEEIAHSQKKNILLKDLGVDRIVDWELPDIRSHALILTGIRRCGKSTYMYQLMQKTGRVCFFLNLDDPRLYGFDLNDFPRVLEIISEGKYEYLFFDEIQLVDKWERFVRQLVDLGEHHIVLSGSNATMLSRELGTHLSGRHISKELFPFSYEEFLNCTETQRGIDTVKSYLETGGFPAYVKSRYPEMLSDVLNDIIYRDISVRFGVRNHHALQQLSLYLISNVGKLITANSLRKLLPVASTSTMMEYLNYFENAYLAFYLPMFSYSYKKQIQNPRKVYAIDTGMVSANSTSFSNDEGRKFENLVFLSLRRRHNEIFYFSGKGECDFVICKKGKPQSLIQVCLKLTRDNLKRELDGLHEAMEYFSIKQGLIVTLEQEDQFKKNSLKVIVKPFHQWESF